MVLINLDLGLFAVGTTILGVILYLITYRIYKLTRGGSKGWLYLGTAALAASFWAAIGQLIGGNTIIELLVKMILLPLIAVLAITTTTTLTRDMKIERPKWFTTKNVLYYLIVVYVIILIYNLVTPIQEPFREMASVALLLIPFAFTVTAFGGYVLYRGMGKSTWIIFIIASLLIASGAYLATYLGNCCGVPNPTSTLCANYDLNVPSHPIPCIEPLIPIAFLGRYIILIGMALYIIFLLMLWIPMEFPKIPKK